MASSAPRDLTARLLKHERAIVALGLTILVALAWWFVARGAGLGHHAAMGMAPPLSALVVMWWLMMVAMMLPSAAPAVLLYARVRAVREDDPQVAETWIFLAGYVLVWFGFSVAAAIAQHLLVGAAMAFAEPAAQAALLVAAGVYQLTPLKRACLRQCRSPAEFISRHWRPGATGAVRLGVVHGAYCVGCCWLLMALLFVGGTMNFAWIAVLTAVVAAEKLLPRGEWIGRALGIALIAGGVALTLR